ncbi:MAG: Type 1 glutamine amidotransferase-like domain-containing protein [Oscillospiraceae bacterium]|nr:Type 1 glutamine amidotransferase-like domain-containing protein [Oscillospiraceae bacterium]
MTCFLTSSPCIVGGNYFNPANRFLEELTAALPQKPLEVLFVASSPDDPEATEKYGGYMKETVENAGFKLKNYVFLDRRNQKDAEKLVKQADFIILAGGHVPTQNAFFVAIELKKLLKDYDGVLMGISAGTMNSAETVYSQPEREGEAVSPDYKRFYPGLGLTRVQILPHYNLCKDDVLDGLRVFEDIAYPDSHGNRFYAMMDGSYLLIRDGKEEIRGETFLIADGVLTPFCGEDQSVLL